MEIKIIRIGSSEVPFEHFDDPFEPLTSQQESEIKALAKEAFDEMMEFENKIVPANHENDCRQ